MKVLVLGAGGLIGHKLFQELGAELDVYAALHNNSTHPLFDSPKVFRSVDVLKFDHLSQLISEHQFDVILNCVGITKRNPEIENMELAIATNALFPHQLANWAGVNNRRVIHFSTDCVFDGSGGNYTESSKTTALDSYGKTKALGEINYPHTLTIRSSFIGREIKARTELLEWALSCRGKTIKGYTKAFYSGVSTIFMARTVLRIVSDYPTLSGVYQLATDTPISKLDLLIQANESFGLGLNIEPDNEFEKTPTLDGSRLKQAIELDVPNWKTMMDELAADQLYDVPERYGG